MPQATFKTPLFVGILFFMFFSFLFISCKKDFGNPTYEAPLRDIDGNTYKTVKIGEQVWMAENLRVKHFRNGDAIPQIDSNHLWAQQSDTLAKAAFCYYGNNDTSLRVLDTLGPLYNWYAANDARLLCPQGYHIPSDAEWLKMIKYLGGKDVAGARLKSTDSSFWTKPFSGASDVLGFNGLPAGGRYPNGEFDGKQGLYAFFWTKTEYETRDAWIYYLYSNHEGAIAKYSRKAHGYSVRCIKD